MIRKIRVTTSKTIQEFAQKMTGSLANAASLMALNKLKTQNLTTGQVLQVPDTMLTVQAKQSMAAAKSKNTQLLMLGAAAVAGLYFYKKQKMRKTI